MQPFSLDGRFSDFTHGVKVMAMRGRTPAEPIKNFPNRLREWRMARGYSLKKLGELTAQKHQSVARHETGENQITLDQMQLYAKALSIKPEELLNGSVRISDEMRELLEIYESLPTDARVRFLRMGHAFAEPAPEYGAEHPTVRHLRRKR